MKIISFILYIWLFFLIVNLLTRAFLWLVQWNLRRRMSSSRGSRSRSSRRGAEPSDTIIDAEFKEIE